MKITFPDGFERKIVSLKSLEEKKEYQDLLDAVEKKTIPHIVDVNGNIFIEETVLDSLEMESKYTFVGYKHPTKAEILKIKESEKIKRLEDVFKNNGPLTGGQLIFKSRFLSKDERIIFTEKLKKDGVISIQIIKTNGRPSYIYQIIGPKQNTDHLEL